MQMALMGRIERASKDADTPVAASARRITGGIQGRT
jgi:hypothetical protein